MKRVLVLRSDLLIAQGVENLLLQVNELEVKSTALIDEKSIRKELNVFHPDVLILDDSLLVSEQQTWLSLFEKFFSLRVVIIDLRSNQLHIYDKHKFMINKASDLIKVIQEKQD